MSERTLIRDLSTADDGPVTVSGWVETVRDQKKVQFVVLRDETGDLQLVHPRTTDAEGQVTADDAATAISGVSLGSFVTVNGRLKHDERVKLGGIEVAIDDIDVVGPAGPELPIAADSSLDKRLDWRWIDLRQPRNSLVLRIQTTLENAWRQWWIERDFLEIHTPKLMASPSESNAELFAVPYFETTAYLAQSPQHFKQMAQAAGLGRIFEIAPAFRADPSFTSRHATEFTSVDAEMSWISGLDDVMAMHEAIMVAGLTAVKEKHGDAIRDLFGVEVTVPATPFPRIPLAEARRIVAERGYEVQRDDDDMDPEGERRISAYVAEELGHEFVFLTDYPPSIRAFYHQRDESTGLTKSYDLLFNGVEISTGAQREHRVDILEAQAVEKGLDPAGLGAYLEFFRHGVPPHGGFGMGLARVLMLLLHEQSIRETTYLFRGPTRLAP